MQSKIGSQIQPGTHVSRPPPNSTDDVFKHLRFQVDPLSHWPATLPML